MLAALCLRTGDTTLLNHKENGLNLARSLSKWLFFSVALSLVPIAASILISSTRNGSGSLESGLKHGELLLITVSLCAAAVGDLIGTSKDIPIRKIVSGGGALLILIVSAIYFADISAAISNGAQFDSSQLTKYSLYLFSSGIICSALCVSFAVEGDAP